MILEAAVTAFLLTAREWRNGGDYVEQFVVAGSPWISTMTRRLGAVAGVTYDADGRGHDADGSTMTARPHCTTVSPEGPDLVQAMSRKRATAPERVVVDVMELYTFAAENAAGGRAPMEAKIAAAVDLLNAAMLQSRISNVSFRLVHTGRIDREEDLNQMQLLNWLSNDPSVAQLRQQHGADLVGLWTEVDAEIAWVPRSFTPSTGFHVICRRYPLSLQLYSHEVAHNLGAHHNAEQVGAASSDPYPFARGICEKKWMTIMSYPPAGEWRETLPVFSNPDLQLDGVPLGVAGKADNARMIRLAGPIVAGYVRSRD
jgi:Metallo-peptidase family M12